MSGRVKPPPRSLYPTAEVASPGPVSGFLLSGARLETADTEVAAACWAGPLPSSLAVFGALGDNWFGN